MAADPRVRQYEKHQERIKKLIFTLISLLLVLSLFLVFVRQAEPQAQFLLLDEDLASRSERGEESATSVFPSETILDLVPVYITGAIQNPGLYHLPADSLIHDLVRQAGGFTPEADIRQINLAALITAHSQIHIPGLDESLPEPAAGVIDQLSQASAVEGKVNINTAEISELCRLPGVGEATARKIIAFRESHGAFQRIEDIMQVPGIKEAKFLSFKDEISVE